MAAHPAFGRRFVVVLAGLATAAGAILVRGADEKKETGTRYPASRVVEPIAPTLPADLVAALQEGRFATAIEALDARAAAPDIKPEDRAYLGLIGGIARRLAGRTDDARATLKAAIEGAPTGPWMHKLRAELAALELAAGRPAEAEAPARTEAEGLLAAPRKDRLAEVYREFARRLLKPTDPVIKPDPAGAMALLTQARELAKSKALRARLRYEVGVAAQLAGNHPQAILEFTAYLAEDKGQADVYRVRYALAESQLATGQALPARLTWTDLIRDLEKPPAAAGDAADLRARAMYRVAQTYGMPQPPDDTQLGLGVAVLRRFLAAYPEHPLAPRAAFEIGASLQARGKSQEALDAFTAFLGGKLAQPQGDDARRELTELTMRASFEAGRILQGQGKYDEAIAAWQGYLTKFPNGSQSADAQRAILDTRLMIADEHERRGRHDRARAAWEAFVAQNPLDGRVPELLYRIGASHAREKKFDSAIGAWEALAAKFPDTEPAAHGQFDSAALFEIEKGNPAEAIERFRKINVDPWKSQAAQRIAVMEAKALTVVTPRTFRSGETPHLKITTRNLENLTFSAYRLNPEAYFRKKHGIGGVESLDIGLVAPDAEWTVPVAKYEKYKPIATTYDLKVRVPGVFVVKVTDEKTLQATTLVVGSDVDAIVKASREQLLVFAHDMKTGKGRPKTRVLAAQGDQVVLDAETGPDGVLLKAWEKPRDPNAQLAYLILDGDHAAGTDLGVPEKVSQGLSPRAYLYTDRPAYRPGQSVSLKGVVREVADGQYSAPAGATYRLEVTDSRGRPFVTRPVKLSQFGTFQETISVEEGAPVGAYRIRLYQPGKSEFAGAFEVQSYQLEKTDLSIDLPRTVYYRGETIKARVVAKYQYGTPLAGRQVVLRMPDGRILTGTTDGEGVFAFEQPTEGFAEEQGLAFIAQLAGTEVAVSASANVAVRAFRIDLTTARDVYLDDESFTLEAVTLDALGQPTSQKLHVAVLKRVERDGTMTERQVSEVDIETDAKTGRGAAPIVIDDDEGGSYILRVAGTDRFKNPIIADRAITVSGSKDEQKLRILAERLRFKVGEAAKLRLHNRGAAGPALVAWEGDRILSYRIVSLKPGENELAWDVIGAQFPNFTLTAARMDGSRFDEARVDLQVERELRVTIKPTKPNVGPGEPVEVEITTVDQLGKPAAAEVSVALIDEALLRMHGDRLPAIGPFFYNQARTGAFSSHATNVFRYEPVSVPVPEAVVEEAQRQAAQAANNAVREQIAGQAAQLAVPAPVPADMPAPGGAPASETAGVAGGMAGFGAEGKLGARDAKSLGNRAMSEADFADQIEEGLDKRKDAGGTAIAGRRLRYEFYKRGGVQLGRGEQSGETRESFVETAYWNPSVVTDADGKARVTFKAPSALSRYRFTARGTTGSDTLVGQATSELNVRKDFFVDLRRPAILTEGDSPRFIAEVHHTGIAGKVELILKIYAGGQEQAFPKTVEVKGDGVEEVVFDPIRVPDVESARLVLSARAGGQTDELNDQVPVRPWGVQAYASASGVSSDDATAFLALPEGRKHEDAEMLVVLSPTLKRMIVEIALGREAYPMPLDSRVLRCIPMPPDTVGDRASDLLATAAAMQYLRATRSSDAPEAVRLGDRMRGLAAELVTLQNEDGGWPWVIAGGGQARPSDRMTSARAAWALAAAAPFGAVSDPNALPKASNYLTAEFAKTDQADHETRAAMLHALSAQGKASFEPANALNRMRQALSDSALAYLALTFANLDRKPLAGEVLGVLAPRAKTEIPAPGVKGRIYWTGAGRHPGARGAVEATALASLAFAKGRPNDPLFEGSVEWLLAHRLGTGWVPHTAKGPALAAIAEFHSKAGGADDRYRLTITVNDEEVAKLDVVGAAEGRVVAVPVKALKAEGRNRVHFDIDGRGRFGYAVTLTGFARDFKPDQIKDNRPFFVNERNYLAAEPELDGKPLPVGFGVAVNPTTFENRVTQVALGGRARIRLNPWEIVPAGRPDWEREFLVLEEHLPAGVAVVEGSVQAGGAYFTKEDGKLTFYFAPGQMPGYVTYDVFGRLPGKYRALPAELRSAYEPGRRHLGPEGTLEVLAPGGISKDPYRPTPDELYARGKALFDAGKLANAAEPLEALWSGYSLRDDIAKDAARMLLIVHISNYEPRKVVQYFEILKEKAPELVISFDQIQVVGRAYRDIGEFERAYLVWRAVAEASYLEDARVGEVLRQRGRTLEGIAFLLELWREYPNSASIESDFFGLSQLLASLAGRATTDPPLRAEMAEAGVTRSQLLLQAIRLTQVFLSESPKNPMAEEAGLALIGAFLELEDFESVVKLSERYAKLYPKSTFLDSFQYSEALGRFNLGQYDRAVEVAEAIAKATYRDVNGVDQPGPNKWQAIYILGQIFDARRQPGKAVGYYEQVADRFSDAAEAVKQFTRKGLKLPEVTVVRPAAPPAVAGVGLRNIPADVPDDKSKDPKDDVKLEYRNIAEADVKVYPVDLMRLYLTRRNLDAIAGIDLAGITPLHETKIALGDGKDFDDKLKALDLPLKKEGAYLVMVRGENLYASGIVLLSPLELEVLEEPGSGRVRVTVRDAATKAPVPKVQVKVIGTDNPTFLSGQTDLRGVFTAEGVRGQVTAVARQGTGRYAFHRGTTYVGTPPAPPNAPAPTAAEKPGEANKEPASLIQNLKTLNDSNRAKQIDRLNQRYNPPAPSNGVQVQQAH